RTAISMALAAGRPKAAEGPLMGAMTPSATSPDGHSDGQDSDRAMPATARAMPSTEPAAIRARVIQTTGSVQTPRAWTDSNKARKAAQEPNPRFGRRNGSLSSINGPSRDEEETVTAIAAQLARERSLLSDGGIARHLKCVAECGQVLAWMVSGVGQLRNPEIVRTDL